MEVTDLGLARQIGKDQSIKSGRIFLEKPSEMRFTLPAQCKTPYITSEPGEF